jgi:hypothetical protein
VAAHAG